LIVGACHADSIIHLEQPAILGRTNPANRMVKPGGVAANIARALVAQHSAAIFAGGGDARTLQFIGAIAADDAQPLSIMLGQGIAADFARIAAQPASYTAILDADGELVIGAASMALYDHVTPDDILPLLPKVPSAVILDANFPAATLAAIAAALPANCRLFAAGTSTQKVQRLAPFLNRVDALVLNHAEAGQLTDSAGDVTAQAELLAGRLHSGGYVLVSDGPEAAALACGGSISTAKPPTITLVNANGAGDVMAAALFAQLLDSQSHSRDTQPSLDELLRNAVVAGAGHAAGDKG